MSSKAARERYLHKRTQEALNFVTLFNFKLERLNNGYQLRIEDSLDVYPVNGRWCWILTGERGDWDTAEDLRKVMLAETDPIAYITKEGFKTTAPQPNVMNIISVKAPKQMWARLLWAKIRGKR